MKHTSLTANDLTRQIAEIQEREPKLTRDQLFVVWFLRAFLADSDEQAINALCGGANDKSTDGVLIDDTAKTVFVVQGKYRKGIGEKPESRNDVIGFAQLATALTGEKSEFNDAMKSASPEVQQRLGDAWKRVKERGYRLRLYYVTTGRCSPSIIADAETIARRADGDVAIEVFMGKRLLLILNDYVDGVAPPVPSLDLPIDMNGGPGNGLLCRFDPETKIESWVFSMNGKEVGGLFEQTGIRLFARNVRVFLGSTEINRGMESTLGKEPEYFWYYNNGVTIVCDEATFESSAGRSLLRVTNPQVINGQQTTRTLAKVASKSELATVLVKVIRVPRESKTKGNGSGFESLVSQIVSATNWQNEIKPSDLMSNDRRQIEIERALRKLNYLYVRKRQTKSEARRAAGSQKYTVLTKEGVAQAVAACELESSLVREGKEGLFSERFYPRVFPTPDPWFYLSRYRLMRDVSWKARGTPSRAYAKWLVLHFVWGRLKKTIVGRNATRLFVEVSEQVLPPLNPLLDTIDVVYRAAMRFYKLKRKGTGQKAQDVSTFFKGRALDGEFANWWRSSENPHRKLFEKRWKRFEESFAREIET